METDSSARIHNAESFLAGDGEMAQRIRDFDWSATLGPISAWPQSLKTTVGLMVHSPVAIVLLWGPDGIMIYNDAYARFAGRRHPQLLGSKVLEGWPEVADFNADIMKVVMAGGTLTYQDRELVLDRRGVPEQGWMDLGYSPVITEDGKPGGVIAIVVETTARVLAQRNMLTERDLLANLFSQAPSFMALVRGREHRFELANPGYMELVGGRDVIGRTVAEALPEVVEQGFTALLDRVFDTGESYAAQAATVKLRDQNSGEMVERYLDFVYQPISDAGGRCVGIFMHGVDVTERTKAERRRDTLAKLTDALTGEDDPDCIMAITTRIVGEDMGVSVCAYADMDEDEDGFTIRGDWAAPGSRSIVGRYSLAAFGKKAVHNLSRGRPLVINDNRVELAPEEAATFQAIGITATICMPLVKGGKLTALMAIHDKAPRMWTIDDLALVREVTERSWAHIERIETQVALADLNATLERRVEERTKQLLAAEDALRQAQKMEAVGQLTGGLAHDFNNLLGAIGGSLSLIRRRIADGKPGAERYIDAGQDALRRAAALTQRLLAFSRRQTLDPKPTDVNKLVNGMADLIRRSVGPDVAVAVVGADGLWAVKVDVSQLESALLNLCLNGRDAMAPGGGRLTIETRNTDVDGAAARVLGLKPGRYVSLCVTDTGTGMTPDVIERAFDPFFTTKPIGQGTGLGLSMVYGFVRQSGGEVRISSDAGKGATVCLYLPRFADKVDDVEIVADEPDAPPGSGECILVVDDEAALRMVVADVLTEAGYHVLQAGSGAEGLRQLETHPRIELLITDVGLPGGMNGRQVAEAARARRPELKVLFITGYAETAAISSSAGGGGLGEGMDVVTKPFDLTDFAAKVRTLLDRSEA